MFKTLKQALWGALFGTLIATQALGQATLLPNAKQQFFTPQGIPAAAGTVDMYVPSTTTRKTTWKSPTESTGNQNTNPVLLDGGGFAVIYGDGSYRQVVKDADGNTIWDAITASTGSGGGGGGVNPATGDGNLVGTVLAWSGWSIPSQYMVADGTIISRTTYPELLAALTQVVNVICTVGLPALTGLANTAQVPIGATVEASCLAPGSTVIAKGTNSLTMSNNASVSTAVAARIFFFGDGDRSTTFNLPDLRSTVVAGQDTSPNRGARNVLVPPYFPLNGLGAPSIAVTASLAASNLPPITPAGTITNGAITNTVTGGTLGATGTNTAVAAAGVQLLTTATAIAVSSSQATSTFTGSVGGGTSVPFGIVQPTMMLNYIIKVTPDANSSVATGVLSLGGMTGAIACGSNLVCTGNVVNTTTSSVNSPGSATPGNIAFWLDPLATTLGSAPTYLPANPANAALYSQIANATTLTVSNNALQVSVGTPIPAGQQEGYNLSTSPTQQAIVGTIRIGTSDTTTHGGIGVAGYAITGSPTGGNGAVAVGIFGQGATTVANASVFGGNTIVTNSDGGAPAGVVNPGLNANFLGSFEADVNINKLSGGGEPTVTGLFGIGVAGGGTSTTNQGDGVQLNALSVLTGAKWANGYRTLAGAAVNAFVAGPVATGASQNSQPFVWQSTNGASAILTAKIFTDSAGSYNIDPSANSAINLRDGNGVSLLSTSAGFGGSGVKVVSFSVAGVVTNSAAGVLASSATLPAAQFPALTGDITTPGSSLATTLATVNGNVGSFGSATQVAQFTVNAKGLITAAANVTITGVVPGGTAGGDLTGTYPNPTIANITTGATVAGTLLYTNIAAPATPASGKVIVWTDSTDLRLHDKNASGAIGTTVVADTGAASNYISAISAAGVITKSRPACATLSDSGAFCSGTAASALTGTTLASSIVTSSLTAVATLTSGTAGAGFVLGGVTVTLGSDATGDTYYRSAGGILTRLGIGSTGNVLTVAAGLPSWAAAAAAAAGTLTGTTLASNVVTSSLTSLGTITSLNATAIGAGTPGTGAFTTVSASTSMTSPLHIGGSSISQALEIRASSGVDVGAARINLTAGNNGASTLATFGISGASSAPQMAIGTTLALQTNMTAGFKGAGTGTTFIGQDPAATSIAGLWMGTGATPTGSNYTLLGDGTNTYLNASSGATNFYIAGSPIALINSSGLTLSTLSADTATTDSTLCGRNSDNLVLKGTGTLGICLGTSGLQFKTALVPMAAGLDEIAQLNLLNYRYREGYGDSGARMQYGLTAQDVADVMPDLVRYDEHGVAINFDIGAFLPIALHALQQVNARLIKLENRK